MVTMSIASAERVTEVINDTADITDPENPVTEVPDGSITFDHVDFSYKKTAKSLFSKTSISQSVPAKLSESSVVQEVPNPAL